MFGNEMHGDKSVNWKMKDADIFINFANQVIGTIDVRDLPKNNLRILFAFLLVFYVVITGT